MRLDQDQVRDFARTYAEAWCSHDPTRVAGHYTPGGTIAINGGEPTEITVVAGSFMTAFPDIQVFTDDVVKENVVEPLDLTGTNTGPGGTGKWVKISGFEEWTFGDDNLVNRVARPLRPGRVRPPTRARRGSEVLLFHHAQGQTAGFHAFADALRDAGHVVHTPDLYDARTFPWTLEDGVGYAQEIGFDTIGERGRRAADGLPNELVYAGFSLGSDARSGCWPRRCPGAEGALLFSAAITGVRSSVGSWPAGVPLQIHMMEGDEWADGRPAGRARARRVDGRRRGAVPVPGRWTPVRRQQPAGLRRGRRGAARAARPRVPRRPSRAARRARTRGRRRGSSATGRWAGGVVMPRGRAWRRPDRRLVVTDVDEASTSASACGMTLAQ